MTSAEVAALFLICVLEFEEVIDAATGIILCWPRI